MPLCFFVSDLHGREDRYQKLFAAIAAEKPEAVFMGGDLLPHGMRLSAAPGAGQRDFISQVLVKNFSELKEKTGSRYPEVYLIPGNDDARYHEATLLNIAASGLWQYIHNRRSLFQTYEVYGYAFIPPTPFQLKDWERYDVSRFTDVGCVSPEEGFRTVPVSPEEIKYSTIRDDLQKLSKDRSLENGIFLFHSPPYKTFLDRAALDGQTVDHAPLDVHVGSVAIKEFIEERQPLLTLHGHIHESARMTGRWKQQIGRTTLLCAAHDGPELALVRFDPANPPAARRELV